MNPNQFEQSVSKKRIQPGLNPIVIIFTILVLLDPFSAWGTTPNSPAVDGNITIGDSDWDADELVVQDPVPDSEWGSMNELGDLYLTWDDDYLYVGCHYTVRDNALLICIQAGDGVGVSNLTNLDWYPRNITFANLRPNFLVALWNADLNTGGVRKLSFDPEKSSYSTTPVEEARVATNASSGEWGDIEAAIPWKSIFSETDGVITNNGLVGVSALIAGSDNSTAGDVSPNGTGSATSGYVTSYFGIITDSDEAGALGTGEPDHGISPSTEGSVRTGLTRTLHDISVEPRCLYPSGNDTLTVIVDVSFNTSFDLMIKFFDERGTVTGIHAVSLDPSGETGETRRIIRIPVSLDVKKMKPGIHFFSVDSGGEVRMGPPFLIAR